jgi:hypothetical protein
MRLPGRVWLQFDVQPAADGGAPTQVTQTVFFEPKGLGGTLYWNVVRPMHGFLFAGQLQALKTWIETRDPSPDAAPTGDPPMAEMRE